MQKSDNAPNFSLDPNLAIILGDASNQAYNDFSSDCFKEVLKSGHLCFQYYDRFYGFDSTPWGNGASEKFGLVYLSENDPSTALFVFRGTDSILDAFKDLESTSVTSFVPFNNTTTFPTNVNVGEGFYEIYSQSNVTQPESMQSQLFSLLHKLDQNTPIKHIIITGHSLGCSLGSFFALDVAVSKPTKITNINFASPRVGRNSWRHAYEKYVSASHVNSTIRIVNYYDLIPTIPPSLLGFKHVGEKFLIAFTTSTHSLNYLDYFLSCHSLNNYQYVIRKAVNNRPQAWGGTFPDAAVSGQTMTSYNHYKEKIPPKPETLLSK